VGGHERGAAGGANGSEAQPPMVERGREHATDLGIEANGAAGNVRRTPVTLPGRLPHLPPSHERLVGTARTGHAAPDELRAEEPSHKDSVQNGRFSDTPPPIGLDLKTVASHKTGSETADFETARWSSAALEKSPLT
jgi:hypothetical protein